MKKSLVLSVATLAFALSTTMWIGCSSTSSEKVSPRAGMVQNDPSLYNEAEYNATNSAARAGRTDVPRYTKAEAPPAPAPAPKPQPAPAMAANEFTLKSDLLQLNKRVPAKANLGSNIEADLTITVLNHCALAVITDYVPEGSSFVKAEPAPTDVNGRKLQWAMERLDKGEVKTIKVWYKADSEGTLVNCAMMTAIPRGCASTVVGVAKLAITCSLPATAKLGEAINKLIEVRNVGSAAASDVVVTDTLPSGLTAAGPVTFNIGELAPGAVKQVTVATKATARGQQQNLATANASNTDPVKAECATLVQQPGLTITKDGTKEQFLGRNASYDIVVSNPGDTTVTGVSVTDTAPAATKIVSASGASISGNTATWTLSQLAPGAKQSYNIVLTSSTAGSHCNGASVTATSDPLTGNAQACTLWKGVPAILLQTQDDPDPIQIGESTTYTIRVTNQGTADDTNIKIVVKFQKEIDPVSAAGGSVEGKTVTFPAIPRLAAKQVVTYTIIGKGVSTGDHRLNVDLTSDILTEPVTHEESTHVY